MPQINSQAVTDALNNGATSEQLITHFVNQLEHSQEEAEAAVLGASEPATIDPTFSGAPQTATVVDPNLNREDADELAQDKMPAIDSQAVTAALNSGATKDQLIAHFITTLGHTPEQAEAAVLRADVDDSEGSEYPGIPPSPQLPYDKDPDKPVGTYMQLGTPSGDYDMSKSIARVRNLNRSSQPLAVLMRGLFSEGAKEQVSKDSLDVNTHIVKALRDNGVNAYYSPRTDSLFRVSSDNSAYPIDSSTIDDLVTQVNEIGIGVAGGFAGFERGVKAARQVALPGVWGSLAKAAVITASTIAGGYAGSATGRGLDLMEMRVLLDTKEALDVKKTLSQMHSAGMDDATYSVLFAPLFKVGGVAISKAYNAVKNGNLTLAKKTLKVMTGYSPEKIQGIVDNFSLYSTPVSGRTKWEETVEAVIGSTKMMDPSVKAAIGRSPLASTKTKEAVSLRADEVMEAAEELIRRGDPSKLAPALTKHNKAVGKNFGKVLESGVAAAKGATYEFRDIAIKPLMDKIESGILEPAAVEQFRRRLATYGLAGTEATKYVTTPATKAVTKTVTVPRLKVISEPAKETVITSRTVPATTTPAGKEVHKVKTVTKPVGITETEVKPVAEDLISGRITPVGTSVDLVEPPRDFRSLLGFRRLLNELKFATSTSKMFTKAGGASVLSKVDKKIASLAKTHMPKGDEWLSAWRGANKDYRKMLALKKNVLFKALTAPGVDRERTVKALDTYVSSFDDTFKSVMHAMPKKERDVVEGVIIKKLIKENSLNPGEEISATNFFGLREALTDMTFKSPRSKALKKAIGKMADVHKHDVSRLGLTGVISKANTYRRLSTEPVAVAQLTLMGMALKQMERLLPTQSGRIERMTRTIVKVLENPRKPKAIQDYIREGGDPETVRRLGIASVEFNPNTPKATLFTTGAVKTLDIGRVVPAHENQQEAKAASRSGSVKEVSVDPRRIATSEDVRAVLGLAEDVEITQAMIKDRVATHNLMKEYDGVTLGDGAVFMFSPKGAKTPMFD